MKKIYIERAGIPMRRKVGYGLAMVVGLPLVYFVAAQFRSEVQAASVMHHVASATAGLPDRPSAELNHQAPASGSFKPAATFGPAEAQAAYAQASHALACATIEADRPDMQAGIAQMEPQGAQEMEEFVALQAQLCRDGKLRADVAEDLMKRAAEAGNLQAQHYFLHRQARALEDAQIELEKAGNEVAPTATTVALVEQIKQTAYTSGDSSALMDLARFYSNGVLTQFDPVMASALQTVALNEGKPKVSLIDEILSESATQQEKDAILAKAQEIFQQCCNRPSGRS